MTNRIFFLISVIAILLFNGVSTQDSGERSSSLLSVYQEQMEERGCGHPEVNANSRAIFYTDRVQPFTTVNYTCDPGFHNFGSDTRVCRPDGTWSGEPLLCVRKISTGKNMQCVSESCTNVAGPQMAHSAVDDVEHTCAKVPSNAASQWKLDLLNDYPGIRQFRILFHGKGSETPVVKIYLETSAEETKELQPSECSILQNELPLDYHEFIIKPNRAVRAKIVNIYLKPRNTNNMHELCEAEVYSEDEPSVHQCYDLNMLDSSEQVRHNLKRTLNYQGRCYTFDDSTKINWKSANQNCQRVSQGWLVQDITPELNGVLGNFIKVNGVGTNYWIGGQVQNNAAPGIKGSNLSWRWLNGNAVTKALWNPPEVLEGHCLAINTPGGVWLQFPCQSSVGAICQSAIKRCGSPRRNVNVLTDGVLSTEIGSVVTFRCPPGKQLHGERFIRCMQTGQWSRTSPNCYGEGDHQPQIKNGQLPSEAIAGIIAGVVVGLILIAAVFIMVLCRRKKSFKKTLHFNKNGESIETLDKDQSKGKSKERLNSEAKENYQAVNAEECEAKGN